MREVERRLSELGYWTGAVDGLFDPATRSALIAFQTRAGLNADGVVSPATWHALDLVEA